MSNLVVSKVNDALQKVKINQCLPVKNDGLTKQPNTHKLEKHRYTQPDFYDKIINHKKLNQHHSKLKYCAIIIL
jgi:hypothetical protein